MKNRSFRNFAAGLLILIVISILPINYFFNENAKANSPVCRNGLIDLSGWNFEESGNVKLNGDWEFYPNLLLTPQDFQEENPPRPLHVKVPARWISEETESVISDQGVGTYRLKIKTDSSSDMLGLKAKNIRASSRIYANGREVGKSGNPAISFEDGYVSNVVPVVAVFPAEGDTIELIIQVANLDYYNGGIIQNIFFGSEKSILDYHYRAAYFEIMGISFLLLSGIYYFGIYLSRRQDKQFLYFGMFCIAYSFITATDSEKLFNLFFSFLPFLMIIRIKIAVINLSIILLGLFIRQMNKAFIPGTFMRTIKILMSMNIMIVLTAPVKYFSLLENVIGLTYLAGFLLMAVPLSKAILKKEYGGLSKQFAIFLLCSIILIILSFTSAFLYFYSIINSYVFPLLVLLIMLAGMTVMFVQQYSKAYRDLENMSLRLIEADRTKNEFLIHTSHEFKTPLHGIMNIAEATLEQSRAGNPEKQDENLTYIISIAARLSSLVNDIIDFKSLQSRSFKLYPRCFDINGTVQAVVEVLRYMRRNEEIKLINDIPMGKYYVDTDENRLKQILINLIGNSLKYTEKGHVRIDADAEDGCLNIKVEDTGAGIEEEARKKLFQGNVVQGGEMNFTGYTSSGLGLSISKMLAVNMCGDLYLKWSELGKGSAFIITLPKAPEDKIKEAVTAGGELSRALCLKSPEDAFPVKDEHGGSAVKGRRKILMVDDEVSNIKVLQEIFHENHYEALVAYNGFQALELLKKHKDITLVLLDAMMPGMSGFEVCKKIRQEYPLYELPVLLLTVRNSPEDTAAGLEAGANDFLVKPFHAKELKARAGTLEKMREAVGNAIKMETAFLQSQIKPHFLYNTLSIIISLCYSDGARAGRLLTELSNYLRYILEIDPNNSFVSLKQEISLVKSYAALETARFGDRLKVEFEIEEHLLGCRVPAFLIQPIVENAIRHGLMKRISGGEVMVEIKEIDHRLTFRIADDGVGIPEEKLETLLDSSLFTGSIGLKNVNKRLINEYGQGVSIQSEAGAGTSVTFRIPLEVGR